MGDCPHPDEWRSCAAYLYGIDCFNHGYWWEAHDEWERLWRRLAPGETQREFLQGLIQAAAALLKRENADHRSAALLRDRARTRLHRVRSRRDGGDLYMGLRIDRFLCDFAAMMRVQASTNEPGNVVTCRLTLEHP